MVKTFEWIEEIIKFQALSAQEFRYFIDRQRYLKNYLGNDFTGNYM